MAVNKSFIGRIYPDAVSYEVTQSDVEQFIEATTLPGSLYRDPARIKACGYGSTPAPPTFAAIVAQRGEAAYIADPEAGIDFAHVVHAEESISIVRPIVVGDVLRVDLEVVSITERGGVSMVTTCAHLSDAQGEDVADVTSALAVRSSE
jgi:acyl dehydratase